MEGIFRLVDFFPGRGCHPEVDGEIFSFACVLVKQKAAVNKAGSSRILVVDFIYQFIGLVREHVFHLL